MAAPPLYPATSTVWHSLYPTQRRADRHTARTAIADGLSQLALPTSRPNPTVRRGAEASGERHPGASRKYQLSRPGRRRFVLNRGAIFLLACIVAVVGGGAIPGPAGTILLVLGTLAALAVAASAFFKRRRPVVGGSGDGRNSPPQVYTFAGLRPVRSITQRRKPSVVARKHRAPRRNPELQAQQTVSPRKETRAAQPAVTGVG